MGEPKKNELTNPINEKIQRRFDLVFNQSNQPLDQKVASGEEYLLEGSGAMENDDHSKKHSEILTVPKLDFDFDGTKTVADNPRAQNNNNNNKNDLNFEEGDLSFSLNLENNTHDNDQNANDELPPSLLMDLENPAEEKSKVDHDETQKTIFFDARKINEQLAVLEKIEPPEPFQIEIDNVADENIPILSKEEAKKSIQSTLKNIVRPKNLESTEDFGPGGFVDEKKSSLEYELNIENRTESLSTNNEMIDLVDVEFADQETLKEEIREEEEEEESREEERARGFDHRNNSFISDQESSRVKATIRQLNDEREDLLKKIKFLKGEKKELEQDNLTLKASFDELKIEISILRKRHMVELEDFKYRFTLNDEKRILAEEKAKLAEGKREKLEHRVRIDFNQVKQREKELETKLEMLTIDIDSQVHSRDQKILELRRKIDSLEFNMENVSIKETKTQDDKQKLEDKLNKIMKTLRHSIKNLEDDIDQATDEDQDDTNNIKVRP